MGKRGRKWVAALSLGASGCYVGASGSGDAPGAESGETEAAGDSEGESADAGTGTGESEPPPSACGAAEFGASPMARLTRDEYVHAVRDLVAVDVDPKRLAGDERAGPFAMNLVNAASFNTILGYRDLAEHIAAEAVADLDALLPCDSGDTSDGCADAFVRAVGRRAYRRPVAEEERDAAIATYEYGRDAQGFAHGIELALAAMLQSPNFLYRIELGEPDPSDDSTLILSDYEIASRMSFFLWGTIPDEALLDAADAGNLSDREGRETHARAMLTDPRAREGVGRLYAQLFGAVGVSDSAAMRTPGTLPDFTAELGAAMEREVASAAAALVLDEGADLRTLLTSRHSAVTEELAAFYGVAVPGGAVPNADGLFDVELPAGERAGFLTRAGVMARFSHDQQTAPILRANFVLRQIACVVVPDAPATVDNSPPPVDPNATQREQLEARTSSPDCQGCHRQLNALAFGFEHYDATGRYRDSEGNNAVQADGEVLGLDASGPFDGAVEMSELLAESTDVADCAVRRHASFGFGRVLDVDEADACLLDELTQVFDEADGELSELLVAIVARDSFGKRRVADVAEGGE